MFAVREVEIQERNARLPVINIDIYRNIYIYALNQGHLLPAQAWHGFENLLKLQLHTIFLCSKLQSA